VANPYEVLGVTRGATSREIERAFRTSAYIFHPDRYRDAPPAVQTEAERQMKRISLARAELLAMLQEAVHQRPSPRSQEERELLDYLQARVNSIPKHKEQTAARIAREIANDRRLGRGFLNAIAGDEEFASLLAHTAARLLKSYIVDDCLLVASAKEVVFELRNPKYARNRKWGIAVQFALLE
jgi:DnaJ domain